MYFILDIVHFFVLFKDNDLQGVKAYFNADIDGMYTLGTVVVDYRGYRITAQSIIPGEITSCLPFKYWPHSQYKTNDMGLNLRNMTLLLVNNKGTYQSAHSISRNFIIIQLALFEIFMF